MSSAAATGVLASPPASAKGDRLAEVDALRGVAALLVMLFHYTTRYDQLFVHTSSPAVSVPWGHLGVNLFFMISGFVILMTLANTKHPVDFLVSRFSRLYPVYWVGVALTFLVIHLAGLPGKQVDLGTALSNLVMFHGLFGIKHVDNVYWTLEVELLFYAAMLGLWTLGLLRRFALVALAWLALRAIYLVLGQFAGIELPYIVARFLILQYVPYFIIGMTVYNVWRNETRVDATNAVVALVALGVIVMGEGLVYGAVALVLGALLYLAVMYRPRVLRMRSLLWLGAVSYPLYLVHENIGWAAILLLEGHGVNPNVAIVIAIGLALALAWLLHRTVEAPAMRAIRSRYRNTMQRRDRTWNVYAWRVAVGAALLAIMVASFLLRSHPGSGRTNAATSGLQPARGTPIVCKTDTEPRPLVLVVLGQSNAGNHGELSDAQHNVTAFWRGQCYRTSDPLPGATGSGGSIWSRLPAQLVAADEGRPVIIAAMAVESTPISAWVQDAALRGQLASLLAALHAAALRPDVILWQQGEADTKAATSAEDYTRDFGTLVGQLRHAGVDAPIVVAQSTHCHGDGHGIVRRAQIRLPVEIAGVVAGPALDNLLGPYRVDDCHFSDAGLEAAAQAWAEALSNAGVLDSGPAG